MQPGRARTSGLGVTLLPLARWVGWVAPVCPTHVVLVVSCPSAALRVCGVLGHLAPVHRCARVVCCVASAVSWATWLLFTVVLARCVVLPVRCPWPLGSHSPVCPLGVLCCVCGVQGHLAPVHRCARSVCCFACAVSWASWLLFTGVPARCVVLRVRCPGPPGSCSPVRPLGVFLCVYGVLGHLAPVQRYARSVCCFACVVSWATWLLFTGVPARCVVLRVRCPGPPGSCSPVRPLGGFCCACGVLGPLAPVHRCARLVGCVACMLSWAAWLLFTSVPARCAVLWVARAVLRVWGVAAGRSLVHPDGGCLWPVGAGYPPGAHSSIRTAAVRSRQGLGTLRARTRPSRWRLVLLGTCSCAMVRCVLCALSGFAAPGGRCCLAPVPVPWLWPAACLSNVPRGPAWCAAPRPVRSLSVLRSALPTPWCLSPPRGLAPPALLGGCKNRAHCACRWPPPRQGLWARSASYPFGAPRWDCPWRVPPASVLGCVRCGGWRVWTRSLTRPVSRTVRRSTRDSAGAPGLFCVDANTSPCRSEDATPGSRLCVRVLVRPGRVGRAGLPGAFWCASPFPLAALSFCFAWPPRGWVCPGLGPLFSRRLLFCFVLFSRFSVVFFLSPPLSLAFFGFRPRLPWASALCVVCFVGLALPGSPCALAFLVLPGRWPLFGGPPPLSLAAVAVPCCFAPFFFSSCLRPLVSGFLCFPAPGASGLGAGLCLLCSALRALCVFFFRPSALPALSPFLCPPVGRWLLPPPPPSFVSRSFRCFRSSPWFLFSLLLCAPVVSGFFWFPAPGALGLGAVFCLFVSASRCPALRARSPRLCLPLGLGLLPRGCCPPPPPPVFSVFVSPRFRRSCSVPWFFFSSPVRPRCLRLSLVSGPGCPGPRRCALFALLAFRFSALRALSPLSCFPPGRWLLPGGCCPPPPFVSRAFRRCRSVLCAVCCAVLCVPGCGAALRCCALCRPVLCSRVLCCFVAPVWCRCLLRHALWRCLSPWGPVLCGALFCGVPPCCVLCAVCVLSGRGGACCCWRLCFVLCVSRGAVLCVPCPLRSVRCCASLCWCACVVLFVWFVLLLAPGAVVRSCVLCCFLWCAVVRCWVWWPVVVCWWRVSVSVSLSDRVVCFPVVGVVCCGVLLPCVVCCGAVLSRGAVLLCSAVVLRCCWGLFCPPVACRAVLCCAVGRLCCFLPCGGVCVMWCSFPRAVRSLSSPLCALRCLVVLAVVPCFPVSCAVALCCPVVLCCRALLSFCGAVCFCFALPWPVVRCRAVLCCAVGCLCCFLADGGVCVLWCPFAPCQHAQKTSIILHVTPRWWRCRGWLALVVAVSCTWRRVRSTCSKREAEASRVGHGREGKVHGEKKRA